MAEEGSSLTRRGFWFILFFTCVCVTRTAGAQAPAMDFNKISIETVPISQGLYLLVAVGGNMGNVGVSVGSDGVLLVADQFAPMYPKILKALEKLSSQR